MFSSGERRLRRSLTTFCLRSPMKQSLSELEPIVKLSAPAGGRLPELGPVSRALLLRQPGAMPFKKEPASFRGKP